MKNENLNNMKKCKSCKEEISKTAKVCPKCGCKYGIPTWAKILVLVVIILIFIVGCVNSCSKAVNKAVNDVKNEYKDINGKTTFKLNETFQNKYEKITMTEVNTNFTDYEYLKPSDGNKYVMVKFEVENINEKNDSLYVSSLSFNASADGVTSKFAYVVNSNYKDLSSTVGKGKKTIGYIFYEVPINAQSIVIDYNADFWLDGTSIEFVVQ